MSDLNSYFPIAEAVSLLLYPHGEVVIHDLKKGTIAAIFNNFSKRKVGSSSLIEEKINQKKVPNVFPIYTKTNWDGRKLRSCTATIRNKKGTAIGLFCINLDISKWEEFQHILNYWLKNEKQPEILFKDDWQEKINLYVTTYLKKKRCSLRSLSKENAKDLIKNLHREGAFKAKNAAGYIAEVLNLSRATIYNYLREHENS